MGLSVFDCEICGLSPFLETGLDDRITVLIRGYTYTLCRDCAKEFENPSHRKLDLDEEISEEAFEKICLKRKEEARKFMEKKWMKKQRNVSGALTPKAKKLILKSIQEIKEYKEYWNYWSVDWGLPIQKSKKSGCKK